MEPSGETVKQPRVKDPEQAELELKMVKDIQAMPAEVQDRFKALLVLYDEANKINEEEDEEYRKLELKYEKLYAEVYAKRAKIINADADAVSPDLITKFEERQKELLDDKYATLEVPFCDVKPIANTPAGVSGFWIKALVAHKEIAMMISEKDRPILNYLQDVKLDLHEFPEYGYTLTFVFEKNSYFKQTELKKSFKMTQPNVIEECVGTTIEWMPGCDVTHEKKKKGKGKNKKTVVVKVDSFFNFFESIEISKPSEKEEAEGDDDEEGDDKAEQMDADFELGNTIKDDLVPLALEYYLGVIEQPEDDDDDDSGDEDLDEKPKKKSKSGKGDSESTPSASEAEGGAGGEG